MCGRLQKHFGPLFLGGGGPVAWRSQETGGREDGIWNSFCHDFDKLLEKLWAVIFRDF